MSAAKEIDSAIAGLIERQPALRAVFMVDVPEHGHPTFSVAPHVQTTPEQSERWHALLRQVAILLRETLGLSRQEPVGVLAVMDSLVEFHRSHHSAPVGDASIEKLRQVDEARAVVAELIESSVAYHTARREYDNANSQLDYDEADSRTRMKAAAVMYEAAVVRHAAAIALAQRGHS